MSRQTDVSEASSEKGYALTYTYIPLAKQVPRPSTMSSERGDKLSPQWELVQSHMPDNGMNYTGKFVFLDEQTCDGVKNNKIK